MTNQAGHSRSQREKERADIFFILYANMGDGRSLAKLGNSIRMVGGKISDKRLEVYSSKYEWQRRVLEETAKMKDQAEKSIQQQVEKMNQQHAQIAQGLMSLVVAGLKDYQATIQQTGKLKLDPKDLTGLYQAAQRGERLARGQATSRVEVWLDITQTVVREFGLIFLSVYNMQDRELMKAEFIRLSDEMLNRYFSETSKQATQIEGDR